MKKVLLCLLLVPSLAFADPMPRAPRSPPPPPSAPTTDAVAPPTGPDPVFLQKALATMQAQRNSAMDAAAAGEASAGMLQDQLTAEKKKSTELQKQLDELKAAKP